MPKFSKKSQALLDQVHPDLQLVLSYAIKHIDFTILDSTIRTKEQQAQYVKEGKSKTMNSKHLKRFLPKYGKEYSLAVDIMPYFSSTPHTDWDDTLEFCYIPSCSVICVRLSNTATYMRRNPLCTKR